MNEHLEAAIKPTVTVCRMNIRIKSQYTFYVNKKGHTQYTETILCIVFFDNHVPFRIDDINIKTH